MEPVKRPLHWLSLILVAVLVSGLAGCASPKSGEDKDKEAVSNLPWNTPANWEKTAPVGGGAMSY